MPYFFNLNLMDNLITLSTKTVEDLIWMSYRYCIGRHTGAAINHARTIMNIVHKNPNAFTKEQKMQMVDDIRREINNTLSWSRNVSIDMSSNLDIFSLLFYNIEDEEDTTKFVYTVHEKTGVIHTDTRLVDTIQPWEGFESLYTDLIEWVKLSNWLDTSIHQKVYVDYNGKKEVIICYPYPIKDGNIYSVAYSSVENPFGGYIASEYITQIKPL